MVLFCYFIASLLRVDCFGAPDFRQAHSLRPPPPPLSLSPLLANAGENTPHTIFSFIHLGFCF
jgi:hypothetical protein